MDEYNEYSDLNEEVYVVSGNNTGNYSGNNRGFDMDEVKSMMVTLIIIIANIIAGILCLRAGGEQFAEGGVNYRYIIENREYGRLISSMFLHYDFSHLVNNMFCLFVFGRDVERLLGSFRMAIIYFVSGISGGVLTMYVNHMLEPDRMHFAAGASGAIYGIMCTYLFVVLRKRSGDSKKTTIIAIAIAIVFAIFSSGGNVDIYGHIGGAIGGGIMALVFTIRRWADYEENKFMKYMAIIITIIFSIVGIGEAGIGKKVSSLYDERVEYVQNYKIFSDRDITYGELLNSYCEDTEWLAFTAESGSEIVQFEAKAYYIGKKSDIMMQFTITDGVFGTYVNYISIDGEPQDYKGMQKFIEYMIDYQSK